MGLMKIKQGDWLYTNNGLGSDTLVYLKKDESSGLGDGWFSAWFYNENYGIDCADWATFHLQHYPKTRHLTKQQIKSLKPECLEVADPDYFKKQFEQLAKLKKQKEPA